jgi:hypothetical protein
VDGDHVYLITFSAKPVVLEQRRQTLDALVRGRRDLGACPRSRHARRRP